MNSGFHKQTTPSLLKKLHALLFGKTLDPTNANTRRNLLLISFLAWIGLGADGLSSACYGPETAYLALGSHSYLAIYLSIATALTVFIIAIGYSQVIELFPSGGGGYKVATQLIGPRAGLASGVALIVDYVLTIAISIASGIDALFSLLPLPVQSWKFSAEILSLGLLCILNMRGMKESIKILMPIFLIFFVTHALIIVYGISIKADHLSHIFAESTQKTSEAVKSLGWVAILAIFLRAYSLGGGTYTGIEAVSNNVNKLAAPRVITGQWTMLWMALSLAFTAGGITFLYLLWTIQPLPGQTLNAVVFQTIMQDWVWNGIDFRSFSLILIMLAEAGLLFVAANTGFIAGPSVLSNMANDFWVPNLFRHLSSRLVTQNGILLMAISALLILWLTDGMVHILIILYSINVFLTFTLSLLGLSIHWIKTKDKITTRIHKLSLSLLGFFVTGSILFITIFEKFTEGGWVTLVITSFLFVSCLLIKKHYTAFQQGMEKVSLQFEKIETPQQHFDPLPLNPEQPTAIFFVGEHLGIGMYLLKKVLTLFPNQYKNFVFLSVGAVDTDSYSEEGSIKELRTKVNRFLSYFVNYCRGLNLPAVHFQASNIDIIDGLVGLAEKISQRYPNCVFFAGKLIFEHERWVNHWLHNHTADLIQQRLQRDGLQMMLLPIHLPNESDE